MTDLERFDWWTWVLAALALGTLLILGGVA